LGAALLCEPVIEGRRRRPDEEIIEMTEREFNVANLLLPPLSSGAADGAQGRWPVRRSSIISAGDARSFAGWLARSPAKAAGESSADSAGEIMLIVCVR
jgi:hypothetical protein